MLGSKILRQANAFAVLAILFSVSRSDARPIVWVVPALTRVGPDEPARDVRQIELWAGRGEYESFQVIVHGPVGGSAGATISVSALVGVAGRNISGANVQLYREKYVHIAKGSPDRGGTNRPLGPGWYADALIPVSDVPAESVGNPPQKNNFARTHTRFAVAGGKNQ